MYDGRHVGSWEGRSAVRIVRGLLWSISMLPFSSKSRLWRMHWREPQIVEGADRIMKQTCFAHFRSKAIASGFSGYWERVLCSPGKFGSQTIMRREHIEMAQVAFIVHPNVSTVPLHRPSICASGVKGSQGRRRAMYRQRYSVIASSFRTAS